MSEVSSSFYNSDIKKILIIPFFRSFDDHVYLSSIFYFKNEPLVK